MSSTSQPRPAPEPQQAPTFSTVDKGKARMMDIAEAQPREETLAHPPQSHVARPSQTRQTVLPPAAGLSGRSTPVYTFSQALSGDVNTVRPNSPPKAAVHHSGPKPGPLRIFLQGGGDGVRLQLPPQVGQHRSSRNPAQVRDGSAADNRTAPRSEDTKTIPRRSISCRPG